MIRADLWVRDLATVATLARGPVPRIGPAMAAIGATGAPDVHEFPVHEHFPR